MHLVKKEKNKKYVKKKRKITCVVWNFLSKEKIRKIKTSRLIKITW